MPMLLKLYVLANRSRTSENAQNGNFPIRAFGTDIGCNSGQNRSLTESSVDQKKKKKTEKSSTKLWRGCAREFA
jgi:hypothetical protein